jgi:acyl-CoA reductase-like NAD-dependent aldehyde dehydrogenase
MTEPWKDHLYINGQWVEATGAETITVVNPATEATILALVIGSRRPRRVMAEHF